MAAAIGPAAELVLVGGAGHAVHLERPAELAELVEEFLAATLGGPPAGLGGRVPDPAGAS